MQLCESFAGSLIMESRVQRLVNLLRSKFGRFDRDSFVSDRQAAFLKNHGVKVVLAEYGFTGAKLLEACQKADIPLVVHFFGYDAYNVEEIEPFLDTYSLMFNQAAAFMSVSQSMVVKLEEMGAPPAKVHYVPSFVDTEMFPLVSPGKAPPVFLGVGRFVEKKAPHLTLLAFASVLNKVPEARLEMAGDGPLLGSCKWLAKALKIDHAVTFHGAVSHKWFAQAMGRVRCFVQHSVEAANGDSEGTPVAVLEAQCSGLPVVATRHTGIADVVEAEVTGYLCEEGDYETMANDMLKVLALSEGEMTAMSLAARSRIVDHFSDAQTIDKLAAIIRDAV
ncbi:glycosyltransferase [Akkermansiaceae bacterium]|nr:glycosyltransferase [Akkermansiaceae bacterium]